MSLRSTSGDLTQVDNQEATQGTYSIQNELQLRMSSALAPKKATTSSVKTEDSGPKRLRPSFDKVLKCLILYNEIKTGSRAKAIAKIHNTPDERIVDDLVIPAMRKFRGEPQNKESDEGLTISLFLLMTPRKDFVIPSDDLRWPKDCAGINLGQVVADIRRKRSFKSSIQTEILNNLHFPWKATSARFAHVLEGLAIYRAQYGDKPLKSNFMVPIVSGTKGVQGLLEENDGDAGENPSATFDAFTEQESIWKNRQRSSGSVIGIANNNGQEYIAARAKAVEDSPWPVHLMGFRLGRALRLLTDDITQRFLKCTTEMGEEMEKALDESYDLDFEYRLSEENLSGVGDAMSRFSPASFVTLRDDSKESMLEELGEQVRLLRAYGVEVDLSNEALNRARAALEDRLTRLRVRNAKGSGSEPGTMVATNAKIGDSEVASDVAAASAIANAAVAAATAAAAAAASASAVMKKRTQGRPRRNRRGDEDYLNAEPVTLAGAVKLARLKEKRLREEMRAAKEEAQRIQLLRDTAKLEQERAAAATAAVKELQAAEEKDEEEVMVLNDTSSLDCINEPGTVKAEARTKRGLVAVRALEDLQSSAGNAENAPPSSDSGGCGCQEPLRLQEEGSTSISAQNKSSSSSSTTISATTGRKNRVETSIALGGGKNGSAKAFRFQRMLLGLEIYHKIHGDHHVPVQYVIRCPETLEEGKDGSYYGTDEGGAWCEGTRAITGLRRLELTYHTEGGLWPRELHNFPLGKELSTVLSALKELTVIEKGMQRTMAVDPVTGKSTEILDDSTLSKEVKARRDMLREKKESLENMGVPTLKRRDQNFELILSALKTHNDLFGDLLVPRYFVVPGEDPWNRETWGMPLGHKVRNIRYRGAYSNAHNRKRLRDIGFSFDYVKDATPKVSEKKSLELGQHWYDGAYELWEEEDAELNHPEEDSTDGDGTRKNCKK